MSDLPIPPRILITGASGFIGKHLVPALTLHAHVRILVRPTSDITPFRNLSNVEMVYGDIETPHNLDKALVDVESVIHCAARTIGYSYHEFYKTNTLGTLHIVQAMKKSAVRNMLLLSTNAVSGPSSSIHPVCEDNGAHPVSHYGQTKKLAEDIVKKSGLSYLILRPAAVYGPHDMDMLKYIRLISQGLCPVIGSGEKYLNLIYVHDLIRLMVQCTTQRIFPDRTFFIHDGQCYRFTEIVHTIAHILNRKVRIIHLPALFAVVYSMINQVFLPPAQRLIRRDKIHELACRYWLCSAVNAKKELGFEARFTLKQGMERTIQWYREHKYLS